MDYTCSLLQVSRELRGLIDIRAGKSNATNPEDKCYRGQLLVCAGARTKGKCVLANDV